MKLIERIPPAGGAQIPLAILNLLWIEWVNLVVLQWFLVRLYWSPKSGKPEIGLVGWVVPFTGIGKPMFTFIGGFSNHWMISLTHGFPRKTRRHLLWKL